MFKIKQRIKRTARLVGLLGLLTFSPSYARAGNFVVLTSEIGYRGPVEFKIKPSYSYLLEKNKSQTGLELLLGKTLKLKDSRLGVFADVKSDLEQAVWLGLRGEFDYALGDTHFGLQFRHFSGLTKKSQNHFYYIPYVMQSLSNQWGIGLGDYGKQNYPEETGFSYLGPILVYSPAKKINFLSLLGRDLKGQGNLFYFKLGLDL